MKSSTNTFSTKQIIFKELFVGTLIYAVVLGFFNDYTSIVYAKSFSTLFFASILLQILTMLAFTVKKILLSSIKGKQCAIYKFLRIFYIWIVMFLSKFVFIWAIDLTFKEYININGFFGILAVVASVTIIHKIADYTFIKLGSDTTN